MAADDTLEKKEINEFEELLKLYDYNFKKGAIVKGTVIAYESNRILVDVGAKTAASVPSRELSNDYSKSIKDIVKIGDQGEFLIIKNEDEDGQLTLSLKRVLAAHSWKKMEEIKQEDSIVEGEVISMVKGGILVEVLSLRGFVPSSHIRTKDIESLIGQKVQLKILSVDPQQNNLIMSHRKVVSEQQAEQRKGAFEKLEVGQVVEGEVVRLADFGAFVDIGGIDGLLPLSQMSWRWVDHPADVLTVSSKVKVEIISIDHDKQRISLSIKSQLPDPWTEVAKIIKEGKKISGNIIRIKHFGAFIEVYPGVEALLPHREVIEYQRRFGSLLQIGQNIETTVARFNPEDRRISLSISIKTPETEKKSEEEGTEDFNRESIKIEPEKAFE
ncbi:MAG: S1 RNA-binding domain-containing protein [bacterium]